MHYKMNKIACKSSISLNINIPQPYENYVSLHILD